MNSDVGIIRFGILSLTALDFVCTPEQVNYERFINGCGVNEEDRWCGLSRARSATDRLLSVVTPFVFDNDNVPCTHV